MLLNTKKFIRNSAGIAQINDWLFGPMSTFILLKFQSVVGTSGQPAKNLTRSCSLKNFYDIQCWENNNGLHYDKRHMTPFA